MPTPPLTIIFSGMIAADPHQGGATWAVLQYVLGLRKLGHEVFFVEPIKASALRPKHADFPESENARYFREVVREFGLERNSALLLAGSERTVGLSYPELRRIAQRTGVLINVSGLLADEALLAPIPRRVYLDLDPAFIQLWQAAYDIDMRFAAHTHFVTIGQALGAADCPIPTCGRRWIPTPQPIVLDEWPMGNGVTREAFTTVANWRGYGSVEFEGRH